MASPGAIGNVYIIHTKSYSESQQQQELTHLLWHHFSFLWGSQAPDEVSQPQAEATPLCPGAPLIKPIQP